MLRYDKAEGISRVRPQRIEVDSHQSRLPIEDVRFGDLNTEIDDCVCDGDGIESLCIKRSMVEAHMTDAWRTYLQRSGMDHQSTRALLCLLHGIHDGDVGNTLLCER